MLVSVIRIVLFIAAIMGLAFGAKYLMSLEGGVRIAVAGWEFNLDPLQAVIVLIVLVLAIWLVLRLIGLLVAVFRFLNGDETAITRWFSRNRERRGFDALRDAMIALASGEGRLALSRAQKAARLLQSTTLTDLVTAQAAEMVGDRKLAIATYKRLAEEERTRFVALRGLLKLKLAQGDKEAALKLAERAFELKPRNEEIQDTLLKLQADRGDWQGARKTLAAKYKYGALPRDVYRRRDAVLALGDAMAKLREGHVVSAHEEAIEANRLSPDLVPAAVMAARAYIEEERPKLAEKVLIRAWAVHPHPDLAQTFAEIVPDEDPQARIKRFGRLIKGNPDHEESRLLMAELEIAAEDFPAARRALGDLPETHPTQRSLTLMAAIERGEGADDSVVRGWLARAVTAPRGPQWVCDVCNHVQGHWTPVCEHCGSVDSLTWREPAQDEAVRPGGLEMLPLIVATSHAPDALPEAPAVGGGAEHEPATEGDAEEKDAAAPGRSEKRA